MNVLAKEGKTKFNKMDMRPRKLKNRYFLLQINCDGQDMVYFFASLEINKNYILRQADGNLGYYDMEKEVITIKITNIF